MVIKKPAFSLLSKVNELHTFEPRPFGMPDSTASKGSDITFKVFLERQQYHQVCWKDRPSLRAAQNYAGPVQQPLQAHHTGCHTGTGTEQAFGLFRELLRSQKLRSVPSAFRPSLGPYRLKHRIYIPLENSWLEHIKHLRRLDRTATWRDHSCIMGNRKPHVSTVLCICSRMQGKKVSSNSTTRWYALITSSSLRRDAVPHQVSSGPMIYPLTAPGETSFCPTLFPAYHRMRSGGLSHAALKGVGKADILARFSKVSKADTPTLHLCRGILR